MYLQVYFYKLIVLSAMVFFSLTSFSQDIVLASSNALSGPAAQLGVRLNQGSRAYFTKVNQQGGIAGRQIKLHSLDDGYEPFRALKNTQTFLQQDELFAFFNYVGTPTAQAVLPLIKNSNKPFLMPFTGASFLRQPVISNVFNLRASYGQEVSAQLNYLVNTKKFTKIGLLVQADSFGKTVENGYISVMKKYGIKPVITTRYRRNTEDITLALELLKKAGVEVICFVGTYEPFAELINSAYQQKFTPFFTAVSFISSHDLFSRLKQKSKLLITEVMPDPQRCDLPFCQQFIKDMADVGLTDVDRIQFEGYFNAYVFVETAKRCQENLTTQCFMQTLENLNLNLEGFNPTFSPENHQGLDEIYLNIPQP
jgi:ABC-type branched-subunit amino acid transport system substrate-binding protein